MMDNKNSPHPEDTRNLMLFLFLAGILFFSYDHFILKPQKAKMEAARKATMLANAEAGNVVAGSGAVSASVAAGEEEKEMTREEVIAGTARVRLDNPSLFGSVNLRGGRIDDISLHNYFETIEKKKNVEVMSPAGSPFPKYAEYGWISLDKSVAVPDKNTVWSVRGAGDGENLPELTPDNPVTLFWDNGQGIVFELGISVDDDYGFTITQRVINNSDKPVKMVPYSLITRHGLPKNPAGRFIIHEGPIGYLDGELIERSYKKMEKKEPLTVVDASTGWSGITEKYWLTAMVPDQKERLKYRYVYVPPKVKGGKGKYQSDITAGIREVVPNGGKAEFMTHLFAGAKEIKELKKYGKLWGVKHFELAVDFGIYFFLTKPFFYILNALYGLVGNFGVAILLFTLLLRIAVFPLANTSFKSFAKLKKISPQMQKLREEYGKDKARLQEEMVKLYQREKVNPMAGCLPILIQIPIFFSLYKVLSTTIEMRHQPFFGWIKDLSAKDPTSVFNAFGLIPWDPPSFLMIGAWPMMMLITMIVQRKMNPPPQDKMQAMMLNAMPYYFTYILSRFASGLVIYWTFSNFLAIIQQYIIMTSMGVEPHLFRKKSKEEKQEEEAIKEGVSVHPGLEMVENEVEEALFGDEEGAVRPVSPPKPKKSRKSKKSGKSRKKSGKKK